MLQEYKLVASVYTSEKYVNNPPLGELALELQNVSAPVILKADSIMDAADQFMSSEEFERFSLQSFGSSICIYYYSDSKWIPIDYARE